MRGALRYLAVSASAFALAGAARAQDTMFSTLAADTAQNIVNTQLRESMLGIDSRSPRRPVGRAPASARPPARLIAAASTRYAPSPAVTARVQRQFVDYVRRTTGAAGGEAMAKAFASQDLLQSWARQAGPDGMRLGDVADVMAEYWVTNWLIANGRTDAPPSQVRGVRDQLRGVLAASPAFSRLTDAQKQEMAEVLVYNSLLQGEVFGAATKRHDAALAARLGDAAVARFRNEARIDLRAVALSDRGFVRKG